MADSNDRSMQKQPTFLHVLHNGDDQIIVRELLAEHVPKDVQEKIVTAFNEYVDQYNAQFKAG